MAHRSTGLPSINRYNTDRLLIDGIKAMIDGFLKRWDSLGRFFGLFLLCFVLILGCNPTQKTPTTPTASTPTTEAQPSDLVTIGMTSNPRTLDPADGYEIIALNLIYNLGETLYTYKPGTSELQPQLATEMPATSSDGLTYTIPLREGVKFQDGAPFNAEAMAFSLQRFMENGGKPSFLLADTIDSAEATGEYELTLQLKKPFSAFPSLLAFAGTCAVSPQAYEIGAGKFKPNTFVGTGPYKLVDFGSDAIRLEVFEDYWGEKPTHSGVALQIYNDNSANLFNAFRTGAVDIAYQSLDPEQIASLIEGDKVGKWQSVEASGAAVNFLVLNRRQEPLDRLEVRQAIAAMVNRDAIDKRIFQGQAEPLYSLIPNTFPAYEPTFEKAYGDANIEKAQELLEKAGYSAENPAKIEVWYPSGSTSRSLVASTLKAYAAKELDGAIQLEPKAVDGATFFKNIADGTYPAALSNWYPDFLDADNYLQPLLACAKGSEEEGCSEGGPQSQGSFYWSDRVNQLIEQQRQEQDPEKRKAILVEIQEQLAQAVPYVPLWQNKEYIFAQSGIQGVQLNPSGSIPFWKIEK
nr:ABC transporter substrate-binding protein [Lusitaniella coriacea]